MSDLVHQFDYSKFLGGFLEGTQMIALAKDSELHEEVAEELALDQERIRRKVMEDAEVPEAEKETRIQEIFAVLSREVDDDKVEVQLRLVLPFLKARAGVQNTTSIHDTKVLEKFQKLADKYGIVTHRAFENVVFKGLNWTAKGRQLPKVQLFVDRADGEILNIRFEANNELAQKMLRGVKEGGFQPGQVFSLHFAAQDPAKVQAEQIAKLESLAAAGVINDNQKSRLEYMKSHPKKEGFVDHVMNMTATLADGKGFASRGRPEEGQRFVQKMSFEEMKELFDSVQKGIDYKAVRPAESSKTDTETVESAEDLPRF